MVTDVVWLSLYAAQERRLLRETFGSWHMQVAPARSARSARSVSHGDIPSGYPLVI